MGKIFDGLKAAVQQKLSPRQAEIPKTLKGRISFLLKKEGSTRKVAERLGVSQRSVERYLKGERKTPPPKIAQKVEQEVRRDWKPGLQKRAAKKARDTGIHLTTRAAFGYTSSATGTSTPDPRMRNFAKKLPPEYAERLMDAHEAGDEEEARRILAEFIQEEYFREGPRSETNRQVDVEITDIDFADFSID
jgi:transcriptional regulator with XRE-family HTH domain